MMTMQYQRGSSLISIMIAIAIGLFLLAGLSQIWQQSYRSSTTQGKLSQVQENERIALTAITNVIQSAGYYPNYLNYGSSPPTTPYSNTAFSIVDPFVVTGQFVGGTKGASSGASDTLTLRFVADANTYDCNGQAWGTPANATGTVVVNQFSVSNGNLLCAVNGGTAQAIATGISQFTVLYGVDTTDSGSVGQYMDASALSANSANYANVKSIVIRLTFNNPLSGQPGQSQTLPPIERFVVIPQTTMS